MRAAAEADRRTLSNWVAFTVERVLDEGQSESAGYEQLAAEHEAEDAERRQIARRRT